MSRRLPWVAFTLVGLAVASSCGGDGGSDEQAGSGGDVAGSPGGRAGSSSGGSSGGAVAGAAGGTGGAAGAGSAAGGASAGTGGVVGGGGGKSVAGAAGAAAGSGGAAGSTAGASGGAAGTLGMRVTPAGFPEVYAKDVPALADKIILTFDDGPDAGRVTEQVLDTLKQENLKATFCINVRNTGALDVVDFLKDTVRRIVREGHALCNHTYDHMDLTKMSVAMIEKELADEETVVRTIDATFPPLTLTRAPFMAVNDQVKEIMPRHGVHVNVDYSPNDFNCQATAEPMLTTCANQIRDAVVASGKGIILLHSFNPPTAKALPGIIAGLRAKGKQFATVEDVVKGKYGKTSLQLYFP